MTEEITIIRSFPIVGPIDDSWMDHPLYSIPDQVHVAVEEYPYGKPLINDVRPDGHSSFQVLYGSSGIGTRLLPSDFDIAKSFYKFEMDFTHGFNRVATGSNFWGITELEIKPGPSILQTQVKDINGNKLVYQNILIFLTWPDAEPEFPSPEAIDPKYGPLGGAWTAHGVVGQTEGHGDVGFGTSGGSHIGDNGGPFTLWCASDNDLAGPRLGSDAIHRVGWFDEHVHLNPTFKVMRKGGSIPPPSDDEYYLVDIENGVITKHMQWLNGPPSTSGKGLGLYKDGQVIKHLNWNEGQP